MYLTNETRHSHRLRTSGNLVEEEFLRGAIDDPAAHEPCVDAEHRA